MGTGFGEGVFSSVLEHIRPDIRPAVEFSIFILLVMAAVTAALNPILEFIQRVWQFAKWTGNSVVRTIKRWLTKEPPPPPPPQPGRHVPEERTVWELRAPTAPIFPATTGIPIITIANMKGGVGKTTIAANLAVYFRDTLGKPTLLIDFDYQGSLTQTIRGEAGYTVPDITADVLLWAPHTIDDPILFAREMRRRIENIFLYPTTYPFATIENNLMSDWLRSDGPDLMYRLCALLKTPAYQEKFGAIIIDCPPRLTTGSINALCASTHLLVPTTLDEMSSQAATYFLDQVSRMGQTVFPRLKVLGVVPTLTYRDAPYLVAEKAALRHLSDYGKRVWRREDLVLSSAVVPRTAKISNHAGVGVAYVREPDAKQIFDRLGAEITKRL